MKLTPVKFETDNNDVFIEMRKQRDKSEKWVITRHGSVLAKDCEWEFEPSPSSRDDAFIERTRFNTFDEAVQFLSKLTPNAALSLHKLS
mgnify:CR=1 FL=1